MGHPNAERLRKKLESMHIFYYNYIDDIKYITEKCILCKIKSKNVKILNDNPRPIIFMYPRDRYILDVTDIPNNIDNTDYNKYLLNIVDHFSKLSKTYVITNKTANNILDKLIDFINIYGVPKSIGTDNGKEFNNSLLKDFCMKKNITMVHGLPYKPHSQGVVERLHKTIRGGIILSKFVQQNKFNLEMCIDIINKIYNQTINTVTEFSPNEIFWSTNNEVLKKVYYNTCKFYTNYKTESKKIECGDKCVISNKLYIKSISKKNEVILEESKVTKKNEIFSIPGEIIKNLNGNTYLILIAIDIKELNLSKNSFVRVKRNNFRLIEDEEWYKILYNIFDN